MDRAEILTWVVCGCCALLCIIVIYLCVIVRRIRRDLQDLSSNGNLIYTEATDNRRDKKNKEDNSRKRESSSATRYTIEPGKDKVANRHSSTRLDPQETVTYLTRAGEDAQQEHIPLEFVNEGFVLGSARDVRDSNSDTSNDITQPIYSNEEVFQEQENNNPEPLYQNKGELAIANNPERPRLQTLDIKDI